MKANKTKLSKESSLGSDIPTHLVICPMKNMISKDTCSPTFTAALLILAETQT